MSYRAMSGFGAYNPKAPGCYTTPAEIKITQQMLKDLGYLGSDFKPLTVDGVWGDKSATAMGAYAAANALGLLREPKGDVCAHLKEDWQKLKGIPATTPEVAPSAKCPEGQVNVMGFCIPNVFPGGKAPQPGQPGTDKACPAGQVNVLGFCLPDLSKSIPGVTPVVPGPNVEPVPGPFPPPKPQPSKGLSTNAKIAIGVGAALFAGIAIYAATTVTRKRTVARAPLRPVRASGAAKTEMMEPMTPNKRRKPKKAKRSKKNFVSKPAKAKKAPKRAARRRGPGMIITIGKGQKARRWGHTIPPKKHRRKGATKQSQYAWRKGFKYPIYDAKHVRAAAGYYPRFKERLPMNVRREIAKNINAAKKKFHVGGHTVKPNRRKG